MNVATFDQVRDDDFMEFYPHEDVVGVFGLKECTRKYGLNIQKTQRPIDSLLQNEPSRNATAANGRRRQPYGLIFWVVPAA